MTCGCGAGRRDFATGTGFKGPLDLRAPEERFVAGDDVEERFQQAIETHEIDDAIADVNFFLFRLEKLFA